MKHVFYFIGIVFIIYEIIWLIDPIEQVNRTKRFKDEAKKNKGKSFNDMSKEYKSLLVTKGIPNLIFTLWFFSGLLTFNWIAFILILAFNFIMVAPVSKASQFNLLYIILHWFNSLIGVIFGVFVIINSYHLKIDLYKLILDLLHG